MDLDSSQTMVYLGSADDVVHKYPWQGIQQNEAWLMNSILNHVLFGNPILINDGYLVNHPQCREDLLKGNDGLLISLAKKGFVKILTRKGIESLHKMPKEMAEDVGIESFEELLNRDDWNKIEYCLEDLESYLDYSINCFKWPPFDMGDGFRVLLEDIVNRIDSSGYGVLEFGTRNTSVVIRCLDEIVNRLINNTSGARDYYEKVHKRYLESMTLEEGSCFSLDMMGMANEVYHNNFGITLSSHLKSSGSSVITETIYSNRFNSLHSYGVSNSLFDRTMPILDCPRVVKTLSPSVLAEVVDSSTGVGQAKRRFLSRMREFSLGRYTEEEAKEFGRMYAEQLASHFSNRSDNPLVTNGIRVGIVLVGAAIGAQFPGEIAMEGGAGIGLLSSYVGEPKLLRVANRIRAKGIEKEIIAGGNKTKKAVNDQRALIGSLQYDSKAVELVSKQIKRFD